MLQILLSSAAVSYLSGVINIKATMAGEHIHQMLSSSACVSNVLWGRTWFALGVDSGTHWLGWAVVVCGGEVELGHVIIIN